ncbi:MAG: hypothetical protein PHU51_00565 [Candidatus Nanoarchaeia archaeon]|nr:hypothetical protein [Candidatus Nanoarchaeia archaeon]
MTNIGGMCFRDKIFLIADSMGSVEETSTKYDSVQKLYNKGDNLVVIAGNPNLAKTAINSVTNNPQPVNHFVYELFEKAKEKNICGSTAIFLVGGHHETGQPLLYRIAVSKEHNFVEREEIIFDGSGSIYADEFRRCSKKLGKDPNKFDLVESFSSFYDLERYGSLDSFVNDKFQFGFVTPEGVSRLYHPDISFDEERGPREYVAEVIKTENLNEKILIQHLFAREYKKLIDTFYYSFDSDMRDYFKIKQTYTEHTEEYFRGTCNISVLNQLVEERKLIQTNIEEALKTIMQKGIDKFINYNKLQITRQQNLMEKIQTTIADINAQVNK